MTPIAERILRIFRSFTTFFDRESMRAFLVATLFDGDRRDEDAAPAALERTGTTAKACRSNALGRGHLRSLDSRCSLVMGGPAV
ncbi:hypothetical protein [Streptomyces sp. NPDC001970]